MPLSPNAPPRRLRWFLLVTLLVLALGAVEDLYGNTDSGDVYGSDGVQYLDIARAIGRHDWHSALNPLWSQGYPALLAMARPLFPEGPSGDWADTRAVNLVIFTADWAAFLYLFFGLSRPPETEKEPRFWLPFAAAVTLFLATQLCLGQVSRVNPDELVSTLFFLACGVALRYVRQPSWGRARALGWTLGLGFLAKAILLPVGAVLTLTTWAATRRHKRPVFPMVLTAGVFAMVVGFYGMWLSHATGYATLGDSGALNYAWHVDRMHKWVHWEGGNDPADVAWPKPWIARFARWDTSPPDFGTPIHPSRIVQNEPKVYAFNTPFHATYTPYFDPPYWYQGYRKVHNWRYQTIAVAKSFGDLAAALAHQPAILLAGAAILLLWLDPGARTRLRARLPDSWPILAAGLFGVLIYLPVHLEGRYLTSFFAAGLLTLLAGLATPSHPRAGIATVLLLLGLGGSLALSQRGVWTNLLYHRRIEANEEWRIAEAVLAEHLPPGSPVGDIAWTANLHSDWAYMSRLEIIAETASPDDVHAFFDATPARQQHTLDAFRSTGAVAIFSREKPATCACPGWKQLGETPMWMYRF